MTKLKKTGGSGLISDISHIDKVTQFFTIKYDTFIFELKTIAKYDNKNLRSVAFELGGTGKRNCVEATVIKSQNIALLDTVKYHEKCTINSFFPEGNSSIMVKIMLDFILKNFQWAYKTKLEDFSMKNCGNKSVFLYWLLIAFRGKTWYESNLDALMRGDLSIHNKYIESKKNFFLEHISKDGCTFSDFSLKYKIPEDENYKDIETSFNKNTTKSYGDFINDLKEFYKVDTKTGRDLFCKNVMPWLQNLLTEKIYFDTIWYIDMTTTKSFIDNYTVTQTEKSIINGESKIIKYKKLYRKPNLIIKDKDL